MPQLNNDFFKACGSTGGKKSTSKRYRSLVTNHVSTRTGISRIHDRLGVSRDLVVEVTLIPAT